MIRKIDHLGVAVKSIEEACAGSRCRAQRRGRPS
jgi:hypothetical protein